MTNTTKSSLRSAALKVDDSVSRPTGQRYRREVTYHVGGEVLQVILERDSYDNQSFARVSVLSVDRKWTVLASAQREQMAALPSPYEADRDVVLDTAHVVAELLLRACAILGV